MNGAVVHCAAMSSIVLPSPLHLRCAVQALHAGQVIAYPTEAVWGLGCNPFDEAAVRRLLALKQRSEAKGLIIIAADTRQILPWLAGLTDSQRDTVLSTWPGPFTWVVPAPAAPEWLRGKHPSLAVRVSAHPGVQALCRAWGGPLVSTSANLSGKSPARNTLELRRQFGDGLGYILPGRLGGDPKPSEIRDAVSGVVLRAR
ncbi:MAG: tRNA threonylcarbamoyladenosine biosynthesis protein RimN [Moraxellaceae bacterium]|nr:tRNA threonylcarbamoyladenosine biosynthesis protein RimN [Moraxellaceae bacterium]